MPQIVQNWWRMTLRLKVYSVSASRAASRVKLSRGVKASTRAEALAARAVAGDGGGDVDVGVEGDGAALAGPVCGARRSFEVSHDRGVEAEDPAGAGVGR